MTPAFRAMIRKDLRLFFNDRRAVIMSFVAPIVIGAFFGYIFGGLGGQPETSQIHILIADADQSNISREIVKRLESEKNLDAKLSPADAARDAVRKGSASVAVVIPKGFGEQSSNALFTGRDKPTLGLLYDPSHASEKGMVQGLLTGGVMQAVTTDVFNGTSTQNLLDEQRAAIASSTDIPPDQKAALANLLRSVQDWRTTANSSATPSSNSSTAARGLSMPSEIKDEAVTARAGVAYNAYAHSFGGMGVQFILLMAIDMGIGVLLQRQRGLWKRFRAAPISRPVMLGSRAVSSTMISMIILIAIFAVARVGFGVRIEGSMAGFFLVTLAFSLMTAAFGLMIAAIGTTPEATRGLASFITLIMVMLGGAWVPSFIFPEWLQKITIVIPTRWAIDALDGVVWRGMHFTEALTPAAVLLAFAALFGVIAVRRFRWEAE